MGSSKWARRRRNPLAAASAILVSTAFGMFARHPAIAQEMSAGNGPAPIETVVVTAQKKGVAESAQSVPLAITVVDNLQIDALHVRTLQDLTTAAPNVTLWDGGTVPGFANFSIRGLGINSTIPSVEPAVGVFVDGIYLGQSAGVVLDLFDLNDIEILRGPQGLLFGRNTTGGAILVNTRRPGDQFAIHGRVSAETGPQETIGLSVEGPLGNQFRAKLTGYYDNDSGWFKNILDGKRLGAKRTEFVRPMLVWTPNQALDTTLIYERGSTRGQGAVAQNPASFHGFQVSLNNPGYDRLDWNAVTVETNWRIAPGIITNLAGYRSMDQDAASDIDARPISAFDGFTVLRQHQWSEELRYAGRLFDSIEITSGLYYFTQNYFYLERRSLAGGAIDSTMGATVKDKSYAAFAQADYHLTPEFGFIAGARMTRDEKEAQIATFVPISAASRCNFTAETCKYNFPGPAFPGSPGSDAWNNFTPKVGFEWQTSASLYLYGDWTRGFRSGGYNVRNTSTSIPPGPYSPEQLSAFEVGAKSDLFDHRIRANAALFYENVDDILRDVSLTDPVVGIVQVTRNTADATIKGFELEVTGAVTSNLLLSGNAGYTDGHYNRVLFDLDGGGIGASDRALDIPRLAKWSYSIGVMYNRVFANDYSIQLRTDYGYRSSAAYTDSNSTFVAPIKNWTASASLTLPDRHWVLSAYGRNLLNTVTDGVVTPLPLSLGGGAFRTLNEGRVYGVEASFRY